MKDNGNPIQTVAGREIPVASALPQRRLHQRKLAIPKLSERTQLIVVLAIAAICGLAASVATFRFLKEKERAIAERAMVTPPSPPPTAPVVVARQELAPGGLIGRSALELVEWPKDHLPAQSFSQMDSLVRRKVKTRVFRGEPITEMRLVPKGEPGGLQVRIPPGMRAMSLKVDPEVGVSGFIEPGSRVDVIASLPLEGGERLTKVVLQNILVLAVGHELESENDKPKETTTVTLALSPEETEKLALARSEGQIMLALRDLLDDHTYQTPGFSRFELVKIRPSAEKPASPTAQEANPPEDPTAKPHKPPVPPPPKYHVVELIHGEDASQVKFEIPP